MKGLDEAILKKLQNSPLDEFSVKHLAFTEGEYRPALVPFAWAINN
jgi:hypothetical protein